MNEDFQEYMIQANALMGQEKYEDTIKYLEKAEQIDNMNIDVYLTKGVAYANMEKYEAAKLEFEKVLKVSKNNGIALFHLGNIEILMGNRARGIELFNNAIANGFDDAQVYFSLGLILNDPPKMVHRSTQMEQCIWTWKITISGQPLPKTSTMKRL